MGLPTVHEHSQEEKIPCRMKTLCVCVPGGGGGGGGGGQGVAEGVGWMCVCMCAYVMWMFVSLNQSSQNVFESLKINWKSVLYCCCFLMSVCQRPRGVYRISWVCKVCKRSIRMFWKK